MDIGRIFEAHLSTTVKPCFFWTMQVSITDFASLAAVAEGKVGLAGSSMKGFAVAQQVIEYSHPAKFPHFGR